MELHLFIVWENAVGKQKEILEDIDLNFEIVNVYQVTWTNKNFSTNLSRFYGQKLPRGSGKERHCGTGPFTLIVVRDYSPKYQDRVTSQGIEAVNTRMFDSKDRYRTWTGGGHKIHATNSSSETCHDLTLLLGVNPTEYQELNAGSWSGQVQSLNDDLVGANGWKTLDQLFYVINQCSTYVVLRNFEQLPNKSQILKQGDIDLLTDDAVELAYVANAKKMSIWPQRANYSVRIGEIDCLFDFRDISDDYYDLRWAREILNNRELKEAGFFAPNPVDHFYSLLYHAVVHKPLISDNYLEIFSMIARADDFLDLNCDRLSLRDSLPVILSSYMADHGYEYVEPRDFSVFFNSNIVNGTSILRKIHQFIALKIMPFGSAAKHKMLKNSNHN
jgi:hypothetical protein